jgi:prepilin-type N-terminal cleavage/methylation domain-containing protein
MVCGLSAYRGTLVAFHHSAARWHFRGMKDSVSQLWGMNVMMNRKGFTLIELLIVVVIIGILAAIAIPKFATTKDKAKLASVKTDIRNFMTAQESYFDDFSLYGAPADVVAKYAFVWSKGNVVAGGNGGPNTYTIQLQNPTISAGSTNSCKVEVGTGTAVDGVITCP